jgi:aconitate hydratase
VVAAVLSGNRNFEGRINPLVKANYLASPPLVVAYALAGTMDIDLATSRSAPDSSGQPVYLRDIWPQRRGGERRAGFHRSARMFAHEYGQVFDGDENWNGHAGAHRRPVPVGTAFHTYIKKPPFRSIWIRPSRWPIVPLRHAGCWRLLGDSVTTDHISPAGSIAKDSPAGKYLHGAGRGAGDFNSPTVRGAATTR